MLRRIKQGWQLTLLMTKILIKNVVMDWLRKGIAEHRLVINDVLARIHMVHRPRLRRSRTKMRSFSSVARPRGPSRGAADGQTGSAANRLPRRAKRSVNATDGSPLASF